MRDFFIGALDKIVGGIIVLLGLAVIVMAIVALFTPQGGGIFAALMILIGGAFYVLMTGGMLYLFLGIYKNTKITADATLELLERQKTDA